MTTKTNKTTKTTAGTPAARTTHQPPAPRTTYVAPKMKTIFKERVNPQTKVHFDSTIIPNVTIQKEALDKMRLYVEEMEKEIGWLGTTERIDNDIIITDVFLFQQEVHATTTEITPEGLAEFASELLQQPDGMDIWNNMKLWGHSHVRMGINPSGQDDQQMREFQQAGHDYFIRLIANKHGEIKIDVYEYAKGLEFHDVPWFEEEVEGNVEKEQEIDTLKTQMAAIQAQIDATQKEIESEKDAGVEAKRAEIAAEIKQKVSALPIYTPPFRQSAGTGAAAGAGAGYWQGGVWHPGSYPAGNYPNTGGSSYGAGGLYTLQDELEAQDPDLVTATEEQEIREHYLSNTERAFLSYKDIHDTFSLKDLSLMQNTVMTLGDLRYELYHSGFLSLTQGDITYLWGYLQNGFDAKKTKFQ